MDFANGTNGAFVIDGEDLKAFDELCFVGLHFKASAIGDQLDLASEQILNLIGKSFHSLYLHIFFIMYGQCKVNNAACPNS